jgi:hypothetical protein
MSLTPEQTAAVSTWVAAGDNLSTIQKKLRDQFEVAMTYMDVRFLVDDLNLQLKDPPKKVDASDVSKAQPAASPADGDALPADGDLPPAGPGSVSLNVDGVTLIPGAIASGDVTFSDGVTGKWVIDNQGRPGFTKISKPGYRPTPEDGQEFMRLLEIELQKKGL